MTLPPVLVVRQFLNMKEGVMREKLIIVCLVLFTVVFVISVYFIGTDPDRMISAVENQGFSQVQIGSRAYLSCGQDDFIGYEFTAINPQSRRVSGVVCCGTMKGCTIRW